MSGSQNLPFEIPKNVVATAFPKVMKITKIRKNGQNWHIYLSVKHIITLEVVINSLPGRILKMQW